MPPGCLVREENYFWSERTWVATTPDKLVGHHLMASDLPLSQHAVVVSGRASWELMQKALAAGISTLVAVGAPSSLAVELAQEFGMTLVGFASAERFPGVPAASSHAPIDAAWPTHRVVTLGRMYCMVS